MSETSAKLFCGRTIAKDILTSISEEMANLNTVSAFKPTLSVIQVGNNDSNRVYLRGIESAASLCGFLIKCVNLSRDATTQDILHEINILNHDSSIHGIIFHLPIDSSHTHSIPTLVNAINPDKDVDGLTQVQQSRFLQGEFLPSDSGHLTHVPCTAAACFHLLKHTNINLSAKRCLILGRGRLVGKPLFGLLLRSTNLRLTVCHKRTRNLSDQVARGDIVVACMGVPRAVKGDWIRPGAVVIDCGINTIPDGCGNSDLKKLCGDVEFEKAISRASWITPVPGGVGPVTVAMLMQNTLTSAKWFRLTNAH